MFCIPLESKLGVFPPVLDSEPIFQGYVFSVPAVFPACVLLLLSLTSVFFFFPTCVFYYNTREKERGWLGAVGVTVCSVAVKLSSF